jgi:glucose dehydrogenase
VGDERRIYAVFMKIVMISGACSALILSICASLFCVCPSCRRWAFDFTEASPLNSWAPMTADPVQNLLFVPTGNPSPDLYGGKRDGSDYYGSSTVALDLETGEVRWHFQTVHHDIWDYDVGSPPILPQHPGIGSGVPAVVQPTKMGHLFLLNRETGEPLYPVEEHSRLFPVNTCRQPSHFRHTRSPFTTMTSRGRINAHR